MAALPASPILFSSILELTLGSIAPILGLADLIKDATSSLSGQQSN